MGLLLFSVWIGRLQREDTQLSAAQWWARCGLLACMIVFTVRLIFSGVCNTAAMESFLHYVNLPFHEAGHVLFRPFGAFLRTLGGSLGQLLVPLVCMLVFAVNRKDLFSASVCLWWFGENFLDLAPYIDDARAGVLPLLGGNIGQLSPYGFHDWEYLLTELGWLRHDHLLARCAYGGGVLIILLSLVLASGVLLFKRKRLSERIQ